MTMAQNFQPGDFLVFQLEAGYALLRLLGVDESGREKIWHVAAFGDFFLDVESAETASIEPDHLAISSSHLAITNRAFESTQVARISNIPLTDKEYEPLKKWQGDSDRGALDTASSEIHSRQSRIHYR